MSKRTAQDPPGFSTEAASTAAQPAIVHRAPSTSGKPQKPAQNVAALQARAMMVANAQMGAVFQTAFVLYMFVGAQLSLIGVYIMLTTGIAPIKNLFNLNQAFAGLDGPGVSLLIPKAIYLAVNAAGAAFFVWKLMSSGLLPITSADWFTLLPHKTPLEHVGLAADATP